jgi:hypothetical protein
MSPEHAALLAEIRAATGEVRAATAEQRAQNEADRAKNAAKDEQFAEERREGKHGRDWQVLQQRIDLKQTTVVDVFSGVDLSEEAQRVRKVLGEEKLPGLRAEVASAVDAGALAAEIEELRAAQEQMARSLAQLRNTNPGR